MNIQTEITEANRSLVQYLALGGTPADMPEIAPFVVQTENGYQPDSAAVASHVLLLAAKAIKDSGKAPVRRYKDTYTSEVQLNQSNDPQWDREDYRDWDIEAWEIFEDDYSYWMVYINGDCIDAGHWCDHSLDELIEEIEDYCQELHAEAIQEALYA